MVNNILYDALSVRRKRSVVKTVFHKPSVQKSLAGGFFGES